MTSFEKRINRRWIIRCAATAVALAAIGAGAYGIANLALQLPQPLQGQFIYIAGAVGILITYGAGALIERIAVRSWDTWIGDLGPAEIAILRQAMENRRRLLEEQRDE